MIKLGLPNKGRLSDKSLEILTQAGFQIQTKERKLSAFCENFTMEVIFVRAGDIPVSSRKESSIWGSQGKIWWKKKELKWKKF